MIAALIKRLVAPYLFHIVGGLVIAAVLGGGWLALRKHYIDEGRQQVMDEVEDINKEAADAVRKGVGNVRACRDSGGVWNQALRNCDSGL